MTVADIPELSPDLEQRLADVLDAAQAEQPVDMDTLMRSLDHAMSRPLLRVLPVNDSEIAPL